MSWTLALLAAISLASGAPDAGPRTLHILHELKGSVVDARTGAPVPFVNVGVPSAALGTVSSDDGRFVLGAVPTGASVVFSAIGYQTRAVPAESISVDGRVTLEPGELGYRETVSVTAKALGQAEIFGNRYEARGYGFGFGSGLLGAEIGARIRIDGPTYLESANFTVAHTGGEKFLYRVNIYDFARGEVGANMLTQNVIVAARQERGTLTVDLREQGLIVRDDVLLALEWIQDDRETGNANVMFRARPGSKTNLYHKSTSQMPFTRVRRHSLGFYFVGYSLE
jgi:hypothetical protein